MAKFKGIITAILTPFMKDDSVCSLGTINQIRYLKQYGIDNIFVCGSYGAFPTMEPKERKLVAQTAVDACKTHGMKCIVHVGSTSTGIAIDLAKHAQDIGADAVSSVVPFYYSGTFYGADEYLNYFHDLINSVNIDVHGYNNPRTTGYNISPSFLGKMIDIGLKGIKDGGSDMGRMLEMLDVVKDKEFDYYPSSTSSLITGFLMGVESCISGVSLSVPELIMSIYNDMKNENVERATKTWKKVMKIRSILGMFGARAVAAYNVLDWKGIYVGTCRLPWIGLNKKQANTMISKLLEAGIDERFPK